MFIFHFKAVLDITSYVLNIRLNISDQWPLLASHWRHICSWGLPQNNAKGGKGEYIAKNDKNVIFQTELSGRQISGSCWRDLMKWDKYMMEDFHLDRTGSEKIMGQQHMRCVTRAARVRWKDHVSYRGNIRANHAEYKAKKNIFSFLFLLFF